MTLSDSSIVGKPLASQCVKPLDPLGSQMNMKYVNMSSSNVNASHRRSSKGSSTGTVVWPCLFFLFTINSLAMSLSHDSSASPAV